MALLLENPSCWIPSIRSDHSLRVELHLTYIRESVEAPWGSTLPSRALVIWPAPTALPDLNVLSIFPPFGGTVIASRSRDCCSFIGSKRRYFVRRPVHIPSIYAAGGRGCCERILRLASSSDSGGCWLWLRRDVRWPPNGWAGPSVLRPILSESTSCRSLGCV